MENNINNKSTKTNVTTIAIDKKMIALIVAALGALLIFIGIFGDILKMTTSNGILEGTINLDYIFKSGFREIKELVEVGGATEAGARFYRFMLSLQIISFAVAALGVTALISKTIYSIYKKQEFKFNKSIGLLSVFGLQYTFTSRFLFLVSSKWSQKGSFSYSLSCSMGWGAILITIGFFISLIALLINESREEGKLLSQSNIVCKIGVLFAFFIAVFGITTLTTITHKSTSGGIVTQTSVSTNVFSYLFSIINNQYPEEIANYTVGKTLSILSLIFSFIAFAGFVASLYYLVKGEIVNDKKKVLGFSITYVSSFLIANILLLIAQYKTMDAQSGETAFDPGYTAIVGLILGILMIIAGVISNKLNGKTVKFVKSK